MQRSLRGTMALRVLINLAVDPAALVPLLPAGFTPLLVEGNAIAGVCAIRLKRLRPSRFGPGIGVSTTNVAHRIAVEHDGVSGMWIPRRDSSSLLTRAAGGRMFPGAHGKAAIDLVDHMAQVTCTASTADREGDLDIEVSATDEWNAASIFRGLAHATAVFSNAATGWSPGRRGIDVVRLETRRWNATGAALGHFESAFWSRLPADSWEPDMALILRGVEHRWVAGAAEPQLALTSYGSA